jgi:ubiquinone biosynthesis UbiH/UbiF/VisC/COQ6 family hydroxylase
MERKNVDVAIIGAGPAGLSFALCLAKSGLKTLIVDQQQLEDIAKPKFDGRDIAMTHLSKTILSELNVWQRFPEDIVHPIKEAKVINGPLNASGLEAKHSLFKTPALHFERSDDADAPLGYLVANYQIRQALYDKLVEYDNIELISEQQVNYVNTFANRAVIETSDYMVNASLVVSADSRFSTTRRMMGLSAKMKDFGKVMIVCNMRHTLSHENTAQECFQYGRTCAILPLGEGESSIVITVPASEAKRLTDLPEDEFNQQAKDMLDGRLGDMELISPRCPYPLVGVISDRFIAKRFALIGDAAVGMHPVTAHGYNLGLRSADTLAEQIIKAQQAGKDIASRWVLHNYEVRHQLLSKPLYEATNAIVELYTNDKPLAKIARKAAIHIGNQFMPFKHAVTHRLTQIR